MTTHAETSWRGWGRKLGCMALLLSWTASSQAQSSYDAGRAAAQRVGSYGGNYQSQVQGQYRPSPAPPSNVGYRARAPYNAEPGRPVSYSANARGMSRAAQPTYARSAGYRPVGEVRGNQAVQPVRYQAEVAVEPMPAGPEMALPNEMPVQTEGPVYTEMPPANHMMSAQPVEIIEEGGVVYDQSCSSGSCASCSAGGGICDPNNLSHGCNRERCPCPSDEALSHYRCGHYGHYPTLWRTWPEGFLQYRPTPQDTPYDRFRKAPKGMERTDGGKKDEDLDKQLKDLLKEQDGSKKGRRTPTANPTDRPTPDLLPDEPAAGPDAGSEPGPKDGSYFQRQPVQSPYAVRPVGWNR
ncbi:hypothetical protein K2X85_09270 [bacterium]|jgi:hypothetical protein|nr:hypothetical protein [bacterium]